MSGICGIHKDHHADCPACNHVDQIASVYYWKPDDTVFCHDDSCRILAQYFGTFEKVKDVILADAPPDAVFHVGKQPGGYRRVSREEFVKGGGK